MLELDIAATQWINGWSGHLAVLDAAMVWSSSIGVPVMVLATAVQWWSRHERTRVRHVVVAAGLSFMLGLALNQFVLLLVHRVRPYDAGITDLLIARSGDFSFPSDHATAGLAIAAAFLLHRLPPRGLGLLALALPIAVSRVYLGTHYASDVLGGAATALVAAAIVRATFREGTRLDRLVTGIL